LAHDTLVISFMKINRFFELFFKAFHCRLKMGSFFDEFFLLINAIHLLFVFLLNIFSIDFDNFRFQRFVILKIINKNLT